MNRFGGAALLAASYFHALRVETAHIAALFLTGILSITIDPQADRF